ncbi:MAG: D-alanyl-D-alanine carboxypeptidase, partial [Actinomycetota bacterium]|nr:D-alanyl-D-alanine carboxypeptidase [Actinomycetota bacterium]
MRSRIVSWAVTALFLGLAAALVGMVPAHAGAESAPPGAPDAKAWVVVDADTGAVIDAHDSHTRLPPASTIKVLTALIVAAALGPSTAVPVSADAAAMPPIKLGLHPGHTLRADDLLRGLLMSSANDAAVALAERVAGSRQGFAQDMTQVG